MVRFNIGDSFETTVVAVTDSTVFVDLSAKSEGVIDVAEFKDDEGNVSVKEGDKLKVFFTGEVRGEMRFTTKIGGNSADDTMIENAVREIPIVFRDYAKDFFEKMYELKIPIIIISCSIKNIIEKVLRAHNCFYDNIEIYANYYDYSEQRNHIYNVTPYSKNKISFSDETNKMIENRKYVILLGDMVEDIKMVSQDKLKDTITIGFLDEDKGIEKNLEKYNSNFDIVLTNNSSFEDVIKILKI